jgi:hypothetical protein
MNEEIEEIRNITLRRLEAAMATYATYYINVEGPDYDTLYDYIMTKSGLAITNYCTWYTHEQDCLEYSREYPKNIITLERWGLDDDIWIKYFMDGEMEKYKAQIVMPLRNYLKM